MAILSFSPPSTNKIIEEILPIASTSNLKRLPLSPTNSNNRSNSTIIQYDSNKLPMNTNDEFEGEEIEESTRLNLKKVVVVVEDQGEEAVDDMNPISQSQDHILSQGSNLNEDISMVVVDSDEDTGTLNKQDEEVSENLTPLHGTLLLLL